MWDWLNCHLFGRHENGIWCDHGTIYLRCVRCGQRSPGWEVAEVPGASRPQVARLQPAPSGLHLVARRQA